MHNWELSDLRDPSDGPEAFPTTPIASEQQLRDELGRFRTMEPAILTFSGPPSISLQIGLGGPFAGIRWWGNQGDYEGGVAIADRQYSNDRVDFLSEGDHSSFFPDEIIPAGKAVEIIAEFYRRLELPEWVTWRNWNSRTKQWNVKIATAEPPQSLNGIAKSHTLTTSGKSPDGLPLEPADR